MKLVYFGRVPNFGDRFNPFLADALFPGLFDDDDRVRVYIVGTMIGRAAAEGTSEIVLGAGCGYRAKSASLVGREFHAVRGPLTAAALGLDPKLACIDPGYLVADLVPPAPETAATGRPLFVPHWETEVRAGTAWRDACAAAGVDYCSPLDPIETVVGRIRAARLLVTEALHGAVVAESLDVPWLPIVTGKQILAFKWQDWCASIGIGYAPVTLPSLRSVPPTLDERFKHFVHRIGLGKAKYRHIELDWLSPERIERASAALSRLLDRADAHRHRGVDGLARDGKDRLLEAYDRFRRRF